MTSDKNYTAAEIAKIMGTSRVTIMRRAKRENWPMVKKNGNGGIQHEYSLPALPAEIQLAIYNKEGAPAEMLSMLSPAVALAAMERPVAMPTFAETAQPKKTKRVRRIPGLRVDSLLPEVAPAVPAHITISTGTITIDMRRPDNNLDCCQQQDGVPLSGAYNKEGASVETLPDNLGQGSGRTPAAPSFPMSNGGLLPARRYSYEDLPAWSPERAISGDALRNHRVAKILKVLREVDAQPRDWAKGKSAWIKYVALTHEVVPQSIYRWISKFDKRGIEIGRAHV